MIAPNSQPEDNDYVNAEIISYDSNRNIARIRLNEPVVYLIGNSPMGVKAGQKISLRQASSVLESADSQIRVPRIKLIQALERQHTQFLENRRIS